MVVPRSTREKRRAASAATEQVVRDIERDSGASAVAAHEAAGDAHPGYLTPAEADAAYSALGHNHASDYPALAHTHAGTTNGNKLAQANTHESPDTDAGASSLHHTIGAGANQAAAGNHAHSGVYVPVTTLATVVVFQANAATAVNLTDQATAEQFFNNANRNITKIDLTGYTQCRLIARVTTGSASANTPRLILKYHTSFSTTVGDYVDIGTSAVVASLTNTGVIDSGWIALAAGAKADIFLAVTMIGGDAAADPAVAHMYAHFR
jgi:hypothetical protein